MKIKITRTSRVLFEGKDLALASYYDYNKKKRYWIIFSENSISIENGKQTNNDFEDNSYIEENLHGAWYNRIPNEGNEQR